jgi:protein subunit release factor A
MQIPREDLVIERISGGGGAKSGGQHRNKTASTVRITHKPTGTVVKACGRNQHHNLRTAMKALEERLAALDAEQKAAERKGRRDRAIKDDTVIRDYDFKSGTVYDRRSGKSASIKNVLGKGRIDLLKPDSEVP